MTDRHDWPSLGSEDSDSSLHETTWTDYAETHPAAGPIIGFVAHVIGSLRCVVKVLASLTTFIRRALVVVWLRSYLKGQDTHTYT